MKSVFRHLSKSFAVMVLLCLALVNPALAATNLLASWNDGPARQAIVDFVNRTTDPSSPDFIPVAERITTFDNDGTLWVEHPMYTQLAFALDRVRALAPQQPQWKTTQPFKAVLDGDMKAVAAAGDRARLVMLVFHDDAEREYAYGPANGLPDTKFGAFSQSLMDQARESGWIVISMKADWGRIFAFE